MDVFTKKEWKDFMVGQLIVNGFTPKERKALWSACSWAFEQEDWQEHAAKLGHFMGTLPSGMTEGELETIANDLRDPDYVKGLKVPISKKKVDDFLKIAHEALEHNKEHLF